MNVETALYRLKENGYKYTGKREQMVRLFAGEKRYLSAREVMEKMQVQYKQLSIDTIYRNLSLFRDLGILEETELNGEKLFRFQCSGEGHHHHMICTACGKTKKIDLCPMNGVLGTPEGFMITGHKFEIYGYCLECHPDEAGTDTGN